MSDQPHCCHLGCGEPAEFRIRGRHPEDYTEACEKHVGALLGTPTWAEYENVHWVVSWIGDREDETGG